MFQISSCEQRKGFIFWKVKSSLTFILLMQTGPLQAFLVSTCQVKRCHRQYVYSSSVGWEELGPQQVWIAGDWNQSIEKRHQG